MCENKVKCEICGQAFRQVGYGHLRIHRITVQEYKVRFPDAKMISDTTKKKQREAALGYKHTKEAKKKIAEAARGRKHSIATRKKISEGRRKQKPPTLGKRFSAEARRNMSIAAKKVDHWWVRKEKVTQVCPQCGKKKKRVPWQAQGCRGFCSLACWHNFIRENPEETSRWQGGLSTIIYDPEFTHELKEEIRRRDGFQCQLCGTTDVYHTKDARRYAVHHIDYDKWNSRPENLITLCNSCNVAVNSSREFYTQFFQDRMIQRREAGKI